MFKKQQLFQIQTCEEHPMIKEILLASLHISKGCIYLLISELGGGVMKNKYLGWNVLMDKSSGTYKSTESQGSSEFEQEIQKTTQRNTTVNLQSHFEEMCLGNTYQNPDNIISETFSAKEIVQRRKRFYLQKECMAVSLAHTYKNVGRSIIFTVGKQTNKITMLERILLGSHENQTCGDQRAM